MVSLVPWAGGQTPDMRPFFPWSHPSDRFPLPLIVNEAFPNLLVCMSRVNNDGKLAIQPTAFFVATLQALLLHTFNCHHILRPATM